MGTVYPPKKKAIGRWIFDEPRGNATFSDPISRRCCLLLLSTLLLLDEPVATFRLHSGEIKWSIPNVLVYNMGIIWYSAQQQLKMIFGKLSCPTIGCSVLGDSNERCLSVWWAPELDGLMADETTQLFRRINDSMKLGTCWLPLAHAVNVAHSLGIWSQVPDVCYCCVGHINFNIRYATIPSLY